MLKGGLKAAALSKFFIHDSANIIWAFRHKGSDYEHAHIHAGFFARRIRRDRD